MPIVSDAGPPAQFQPAPLFPGHAHVSSAYPSTLAQASTPARQTQTFSSDSIPTAQSASVLANHGWTAFAILLLLALGGLAYAGLSRQLRLVSQRPQDPELTQKLRRRNPVNAPSQRAAAPLSNPLMSGGSTPGQAQKLDHFQELVQMLRDRDHQVRKMAAWELKKLKDPRAVRPLVQAMVESVPEQRSLILSALSEIGYENLVSVSRALTLALQDENPEVRQNAVRELTRLQAISSRNAQLLLNAVGDPDPRVKETARWAVNKIQQSQRQFSAQSEFLESYGSIFEGQPLSSNVPPQAMLDQRAPRQVERPKSQSSQQPPLRRPPSAQPPQPRPPQQPS